MSKESSELMEMVCSALKWEAKEKEFYLEAAESTPNELGKEAFRLLAGEEADHATVLEDLYAAIKVGEPWPTSCVLYEKATKDPVTQFRAMASKYSREIKSDVDTLKAMEIGIHLEGESVKFYEGHLARAQASEVQKFLRTMIQEERGHRLLLLDMQYYFTDPEGYFMEKEHRTLDGA